MMRKKTYIWISSILFMLSFLAAYHSDHQKTESVRLEYRSTGSVVGLLDNGQLIARR
jgi:hypothetical protein